MNAKKKEELRQKLLEKRENILNRSAKTVADQLSLSEDDLADDSDHAAAVIQQGVALEIQERDLRLLKDIDHALSKFEEGTYGLCEDTEEPIDTARLEAAPWSRFSVEAQELREERAKRFATR